MAAGLSHILGGPMLLYALLLGLALHGLFRQKHWQPGLTFASRTVLRTGVALLGLRIGMDQVLSLGWPIALLVLTAVASTMAAGLWLAKRLKRPWAEGLISGASVGICGASAALAVASVLPASRDNERFTLLAVVGVTLLSTLAMVIYPLALQWAGAAAVPTGVFLGGTIHDVAQVVASAMMVAPAGDNTIVDTATVVKLFRVMLLMPVAVLVSWVIRWPVEQSVNKGQEVPLVPRFLLVFVIFMLLVTSGWVSPQLASMGSDLSKACLVTAIAAAGLKTRLKDLGHLGWIPVLMLLSETLWIAIWVGLGLLWLI